jgi:alpha-D-xyloside xylohydrolase
VVQYYLRIAYDDHDTTFVHAKSHMSAPTADEAAAQAAPFTFPIGPSGSFLAFDSGALQARIFRDTGHVEIAGSNLAGAPHAVVVTFALMFTQSSGQNGILGRVLSSATLPNGLEVEQDLDDTPIRARLTFPHEGVMRYEVIDWGGLEPNRTTITAIADSDEHFYGFGEKFNAFDQAGKEVRILTVDHPGDKGDHSYKVAPWFVSTRGYGFHLDSSAESRFDMSTTGHYTVTNFFRTLAFQVVYGPRLTDVLRRYTSYTGRPPLPPPWAFGTWISTDVWRNGGEVRYAVSNFRARRIPASVFVFDSPWEVGYNDFRFNSKQFGKGRKFRDENGLEHDGFELIDGGIDDMMVFFQQNGLKVICWMTPFINTSSTKADREDHGIEGQNLGESSNYKAGKDSGFFVRASKDGPPLKVKWWKGEGSPVDFTSPAARDWFADQLKSLLRESEVTTQAGTKEPAIGGFKTDDGETRSSDGNIYIPESASYADGRTGKEMRNGYCVEYHRLVYNALRDVVGANGLIFARSGFTGTQAFPGCWAGDNAPNFGEENGLPSVIIAGLSAAMSGYSIWAHDVGGYQNTDFSPVSRSNLFMRWTQFGCFSPILQMHRQVKKNQNDPASPPLGQYPWGYDKDAEENFRFYARLHTRLFPYIYTYAKESSESGLPIIRPLVLMHHDDPRTHTTGDTYLFGNEFLVAPVIRPTQQGQATERSVYLPHGAWHDYWTQERHMGGQEITYRSADQQQFPLFVREGAIVPMLLAEAETLCDANYVGSSSIQTADEGLWFLIYPAGVSSFIVYDGTSIRCEGSGVQRTLTLSSTARTVILKIFTDEPAGVTHDGVSLERFSTPAEFDASNSSWDLPQELAAASSGWLFAATARFLLIKLEHPGGSTQIRF